MFYCRSDIEIVSDRLCEEHSQVVKALNARASYGMAYAGQAREKLRNLLEWLEFHIEMCGEKVTAQEIYWRVVNAYRC